MYENKINRFYESIKDNYNNGVPFAIPTGFIDYFRSLAVNQSYTNFYICRMNHDYITFLSSNNLLTNSPTYLRTFYVYHDYKYYFDDFNINGYSDYNNLISTMQNNCFQMFNSDFTVNGNFLAFATLNNNYYDDLVNSESPSEYIISMLYIAIPLILFILGIKVLRKGLFK